MGNTDLNSIEDDENMVLRTVFLPKALDIQLREEASSLGISKGEHIRNMIKEHLLHREQNSAGVA